MKEILWYLCLFPSLSPILLPRLYETIEARLPFWIDANSTFVQYSFLVVLILFFLFIQNTSHRSLLTHKNYTKHIIHTGPTHETHKTHKKFFSENIRNTHTQEKFSPNT